jgi:hypothetical protein
MAHISDLARQFRDLDVLEAVYQFKLAVRSVRDAFNLVLAVCCNTKNIAGLLALGVLNQRLGVLAPLDAVLAPVGSLDFKGDVPARQIFGDERFEPAFRSLVCQDGVVIQGVAHHFHDCGFAGATSPDYAVQALGKINFQTLHKSA